MELNDALFFENRDEWRKWLEKNHGKEKEVWVIHYRKRPAEMGVQLEEAVEEAICVGWIDGKQKKVDDTRFVLRYSPRKAKSVWSKLNREKLKK